MGIDSFMTTITIRTFTQEDIPQVMRIQQVYRQAYPNATVIPGEVYLSPGFEGGKNIFCAFNEHDILLGYAPIYPNLATEPDIPHTIWVEVKASPEITEPRKIKDSLFEKIVQRAKEIGQSAPGHPIHLTFQYHPSEIASIEYVQSRGCAYMESVFRMICDLTQGIKILPPPALLDVRRWRMESEAEQLSYVEARNEAFPEAPVALADWQAFLASPAWQDGTTITAFEGQAVVGSVTAYMDETISQITGKRAGYTEYIFVRKNWQKRGIASYLINQAQLYLKERGGEAAFLEVRASNQNALELYRKLGYHEVDESRLYSLEV